MKYKNYDLRFGALGKRLDRMAALYGKERLIIYSYQRGFNYHKKMKVWIEKCKPFKCRLLKDRLLKEMTRNIKEN